MTCSIVACGPSAKEWFNTPCDLSIGVNDVEKYGHPVDWLVVVNVPRKFKNGRLETITASKPKRFLCHDGQWKKWFPGAELLELHPTRGGVKSGKVYFSKTSPFVGIHLAYSAGADNIILWGVDFLNHPKVKDKMLQRELIEYKRLFDALEGKGVRVWIGSSETVLKVYLPVWKNLQSSFYDTVGSDTIR